MNTKNLMATMKERDAGIALEVRFSERIIGSGFASERGVWKLAIRGKERTRTVFGYFHTVSRKEAGTWKLLFDYDTDQGSPGEMEYMKARDVADIGHFTKAAGANTSQ